MSPATRNRFLRATHVPWSYVQGGMARFVSIVGAVLFGCIFTLPVAAQRERGELQIEVRDPQGAAVGASGELVSQGNQFHLNFEIGDDGRYAAQDLAFGVYRVSVSHSGFISAVQLVEIRSMVPQHLSLNWSRGIWSSLLGLVKVNPLASSAATAFQSFCSKPE